MNSLDEALSILPETLLLEISSEIQHKAWEESQKFSNAIARYNAYLNQICSETFLTWLSEEFTEELASQPLILPEKETLKSIWEFVCGTAFQIGEIRIILIPSDNLELEEFCVPQEWVDIRQWSADYYLAVKVNLEADEEECWLAVTGFATHRQLKYEGEYSARERIYRLPVENLTINLTVMQLTLGLNLQEDIPDLPALSEAEAQKLLQQLSDASVSSPRLQTDVAFEKWAALLVNDSWRQQLYNKRMGIVEKNLTSVAVNLTQWFQNKFEAGWQTFEEILDTLGAQQAHLAYEFTRSPDRKVRNTSSLEREAIPKLIELLQKTRDRETQWRTADLLGHLDPGNKDAIAALTNLLNKTQDDETRRQASVSLGKIDPGNSQAGIRKAKIIDLGIQLDAHPVVLVVTLMPETEGKTNIHLRINPADTQTHLPPHLQLILLDESGESLFLVESRNADSAIQLGFRGDRGDCFSVKVALGEAMVTENFVV